MKRQQRFLPLLISLNAIIIIMGFGSYKLASATESNEIQTLTIAYLYNFMKLSEWPSKAQASELTLCVTEAGGYAAELEALAGKDVQEGKTLKIKKLLQGDNAQDCQLLFIPDDEKPIRMVEWLKTVEKLPVLTVSNMNGFIEQGGMIILIDDGSRLQFEVNIKRVGGVGISLSSKMLQIARQVIKD
jgi:YfiR/HmsC-like